MKKLKKSKRRRGKADWCSFLVGITIIVEVLFVLGCIDEYQKHGDPMGLLLIMIEGVFTIALLRLLYFGKQEGRDGFR